jgi:predicted RNase H-like nuclease (RuvC/YqgF family)
MFWHKKNLTSEEYEKLSKQITDLSQQIQQLKSTTDFLETNLRSLRGLVNRKLSGDKDMEETETKDINNPVILPYDGSFKRYK